MGTFRDQTLVINRFSIYINEVWGTCRKGYRKREKGGVSRTRSGKNGPVSGSDLFQKGQSGKKVNEEVDLPRNWPESTDPVRCILRVTEALSHIKDVDAILDRVLLEARNFVSADAGSIFLVKDDQLRFSYIHNDTLFGEDSNNRQVYANVNLPINEKSMAGYVALTGEVLNIADAHDIPEDKPYSFNASFDRESNYRTTSVLSVPLMTSRRKIVGVMQVINALDDDGRPVSFTDEDQRFMSYFAANAAVAIERAQMTREIILRMIRMAEMRDPHETGAHVNRVGAYSAEIYSYWAHRKGVGSDQIKKTKDLLRIASMLHDVGKVAISDTILKKPSRLTEDEYGIMKHHTIHGAKLFANSTSDLDVMSAEIALDHHQRWDGGGYPGEFIPETGLEQTFGKGKRGDEISIFARIVALADVYDALSSSRVYKPAWPDDEVREHLVAQSGKHFDPELVDAFFAIYETIQAIKNKYKD